MLVFAAPCYGHLPRPLERHGHDGGIQVLVLRAVSVGSGGCVAVACWQCLWHSLEDADEEDHRGWLRSAHPRVIPGLDRRGKCNGWNGHGAEYGAIRRRCMGTGTVIYDT